MRDATMGDVLWQWETRLAPLHFHQLLLRRSRRRHPKCFIRTCGKIVFKWGSIASLNIDSPLDWLFPGNEKFLIRVIQRLSNLFSLNHSRTSAEKPPPPSPATAPPIRRHKRITEYFSVMHPYIRRASIWLTIKPLQNCLSCFYFLLTQNWFLAVFLLSSHIHCDWWPFPFRKNMLTFQLREDFDHLPFFNTKYLVFQRMPTNISRIKENLSDYWISTRNW